MKKLLVLIAVVLMSSFPVFAQDVNIQGPHHTLGIGSNAQAGATATGGSVGPITVSPTISPRISNDNEVNIGNSLFGDTFSPKATAIQGQDQDQSQKQKQQQGQQQGQIGINVQDQFGYVAPVQEVNIEVPRQFITPTSQMGEPQINPLIQGGIGSAKDLLPEWGYTGLQWLGAEKVLDAKTFNGWFIDRICLEDLEEAVLKNFKKISKDWKAEEIRYRVYFKPKSKGIGGGGQGNGSGSWLPANPSAYAGGLAGLAGYNTSWVDNSYVIKFYRVSPTNVVKRMTEADYLKLGWMKVEAKQPEPVKVKRVIFGKEVSD